MAGARLKPVLDSIRRLHGMGVWTEVTTLLIPGHNDGDDELRGLAAFLVSVSPDIPWHVSRFRPTYRLLGCSSHAGGHGGEGRAHRPGGGIAVRLWR